MSGYNPPSSIDDEKVLHATALNDQGTIAGPVHAVVYAQGPPSNPIYNNQQVVLLDVVIYCTGRRIL